LGRGKGGVVGLGEGRAFGRGVERGSWAGGGRVGQWGREGVGRGKGWLGGWLSFFPGKRWVIC
jgi:hypothetical protein